MRRGWLILMVVTAPGSVAHAGACAMRGGVTGKVLGQDGGVVVGLVATGDDNGNQTPGPTAPWQVEADGKSEKATKTQLAPNLVVLTPPAGVSSGTLRAGSARFPVSDAKGKQLAAPKVTKVVATAYRERYGGSNITDVATVKSVPDGAVALIIYGVEKGKRVPRSWIPVTSGEKGEFTVYATGGRCSVSVPDLTESRAGDHVQFAWVDAGGQLSKLTGAFTVAKGK